MKKEMLWNTVPPHFNPEYSVDENAGEVPSVTPFIVPEVRDKNGNVKKTGCVIVCPGGSYVGRCDSYEGNEVCEFFNSHGISAFTLNYRVFPYDYNAIRADVNRAVRFVRYHAEKYNIDPEKIAILGFSAGGHLATMGATNFDYGLAEGDEIDRVSCRPDAAILCYAVISMTREVTHEHTRYVLIGRFEEEYKNKLVQQLSGELAVNKDTPPMFIWHTAADGCVKVENSINMASALSKHKIPFELHVFPDGDHGLGMAQDTLGTNQWPALMINWLKRMEY